MKYRVVIVEDQDNIRRMLRRTLELHDDLVVAGEAATIKAAEALVCEEQPDLLLLDVELADGNSFELLEKMCEPPAVIFISGHKEYAVEAFGIRALDFLAKPFSAERLAEALDRFRESRKQVAAWAFDSGKLLPLRQGAKIFFVPVTELVSIQASREYTTLIDRQGRSYVEKRPLRYWVEHLPQSHFLQLDRSLVVNLQSIDHLVQRSPQELALHLKALPEPLLLGRAAASRLRACYPSL
jgi:two-component system LytT family response regulator